MSATPKTETRKDRLSFIKKFILFVRQQGVIGLAVAFVIGGAIQKVVAAFVTDILNPIVSIFLGPNSDFTKATFTVGKATFLYGDFLSNVMNFLLIVLAIYLLVNGIHADMLDRPKE
jgi:large conductance mechanosensitive channel